MVDGWLAMERAKRHSTARSMTRASTASEPDERSEAAKRRASETVGESEGQCPSDNFGCGGVQPAVLAAVERGRVTHDEHDFCYCAALVMFPRRSAIDGGWSLGSDFTYSTSGARKPPQSFNEYRVEHLSRGARGFKQRLM